MAKKINGLTGLAWRRARQKTFNGPGTTCPPARARVRQYVMRPILTLVLCAFLLFSHGGLVPAHAHGTEDGQAHSEIGTAHDDHHHVADGGIYDVAADEDANETADPKAAPSGFSHHHLSIDGVARAPQPLAVVIVTKVVRPIGQGYLRPTSNVVAPGLEPPKA